MTRKHVQAKNQKRQSPKEKLPSICGFDFPAEIVFPEIQEDDPEICKLCLRRIIRTRNWSQR